MKSVVSVYWMGLMRFWPGGFGERGMEGKIAAVCHARENKIPYLGICLGMQVAVIEFARHVAGLDGATSNGVSQREHPVMPLYYRWTRRWNS